MKEYFPASVAAEKRDFLYFGILFPILALIAIVSLDMFAFPSVTITPPCGMVLLVLMSLRLHPRAVALWSGILMIISMIMLQESYSAHTTDVAPSVRTALRVCTLLAGSVAAILLSHHRVRISRSHEDTLATLEKLPVPMVVSDASGNISFVNDAAAFLLGMARDEAVGLSYFALLLAQTDKGKAIAKYLKIFDQPKHESISLPIRLANNPEVLYQGTLVASGEGTRRRLVTVFMPGAQFFVPQSQWPAR